jgi:glycosyltransferase involved in cell wall biosynthesis
METSLSLSGKHSLGIGFFYDGTEFKKLVKGNTIYYGIPNRQTNPIKRILYRHLSVLNDEHSDYLNQIIDEFKPDLIHVFGTESGFCKVLMNRKEKILINFQGLLKPILLVYFPLDLSKAYVFRHNGINPLLRGISFFHSYQTLKKMARREEIILKHHKYYVGRTNWDRNYLKLMNPAAIYYHCDEILRNNFYNIKWIPPSDVSRKTSIVIGTTISNSTYKGLDLVFKTVELLKHYDLTWKVFGISENDDINSICRKKFGKDIGKDKIKLYGQVDSDHLINELLTCHFYVHTSYIDNSPNSVCEAMIIGMPVIASSIGGIPSLIKDGETGFLFNPYDKYSLAGLLSGLIDDYSAAIKSGINARGDALQRHNPERITEEIEDIYNIVANS